MASIYVAYSTSIHQTPRVKEMNMKPKSPDRLAIGDMLDPAVNIKEPPAALFFRNILHMIPQLSTERWAMTTLWWLLPKTVTYPDWTGATLAVCYRQKGRDLLRSTSFVSYLVTDWIRFLILVEIACGVERLHQSGRKSRQAKSLTNALNVRTSKRV